MDKNMFLNTIQEYKELGMSNLIDYDKFFIFHRNSFHRHRRIYYDRGGEPSVVEEGLAARGKSMEELNMNLKEEIKNYNLSLGDDSMEETVSQHMHR